MGDPVRCVEARAAVGAIVCKRTGEVCAEVSVKIIVVVVGESYCKNGVLKKGRLSFDGRSVELRCKQIEGATLL